MKESFIFLFAILGVLLGYQGIKRNEYILVLNKDDTSLLPPNMQLLSNSTTLNPVVQANKLTQTKPLGLFLDYSFPFLPLTQVLRT